jgi:hypothetical protein
MKLFSSKIHGFIDYVLGVVLLAAPYLFGFSEVEAAARSAQLIGLIVLAQSIMTDYELGLFKIIPMRVHLMLDLVASLFLAASPFLFSFSENGSNVWLPHVVTGIAYLLISLTTTSQVEPTGNQRHTAAFHA